MVLYPAIKSYSQINQAALAKKGTSRNYQAHTSVGPSVLSCNYCLQIIKDGSINKNNKNVPHLSSARNSGQITKGKPTVATRAAPPIPNNVGQSIDRKPTFYESTLKGVN